MVRQEVVRQVLRHRSLIEQVAAEKGVDAALIAGLVARESEGFERALNRRSGAAGLGQVLSKESIEHYPDQLWLLQRPTREQLFDPLFNLRYSAQLMIDYGVKRDEYDALKRYSGRKAQSDEQYEREYWNVVQAYRTEFERLFAVNPIEDAQQYKVIAYWGGSGIARAARRYGLVPISNEFAGEGTEVRQLWADDVGNEHVWHWRAGWDEGRLLYPETITIDPPAPTVPRRDWTLAVSHLSQLDIYPDSDFATGDCGPVSFAMWAQRNGKYFTPDSFSETVTRVTGRPSGYSYTSRDDLVMLGRWFALPCERVDAVTLADVRHQIVENEKPLIALVHAGNLRMRSYSFEGGHYVLIVGVIGDSIQYHDPYERRDGRGSFVKVGWDEFSVAWQNATSDGNQAFSGVRFI